MLQDVYGQFHGWVQVNDQPPLLGQVALACDVITTTYDRTQNPLQAIVDASYYFRSNGSANWCYSFNSNHTLIAADPDASLRAYSYQVWHTACCPCCATLTMRLWQRSSWMGWQRMSLTHKFALPHHALLIMRQHVLLQTLASMAVISFSHCSSYMCSEWIARINQHAARC